jgi:hypothetical protein
MTAITRRQVAWRKDDPFGAEFAEIHLKDAKLEARGYAIGATPVPYQLQYELETHDRFVTAHLRATTTGEGWGCTLRLERDDSGHWDISDDAEGDPPFEVATHELIGLEDALDVDLGLSPVTNSAPVLRHDLLRQASSTDLVVAWVSEPDLVVHPERQRYTSDPTTRPDVVRFASLDGTFEADIVFDADGIVVEYPGIARRL